MSLSPTEPASPRVTADFEFEEEERPKPGSAVVTVTPVDRWREATRAGLAIGLTLLLATVVLIIILLKSATEARDLLSVLLAPLVGLVGAATGFYYGGKEEK
jgi:hypothetical protein